MRVTRILLCASAIFVVAGSATAASRGDYADCEQTTDLDRRIAGCTQVIQDRSATAKIRSTAHFFRGEAYFYNKDDTALGIQDFSEAIRLNPEHAAAHYARGDAYKIRAYESLFNTKTLQFYVDLSLRDFSEAIRLRRDAPPLYFINRSNVYLLKREYERAISDLDAAIKLDPKDENSALTNRCKARAMAAQYQAALADCTESMKRNSNDPSSLDYSTWSRGFVHLKMKSFDKSIADFDAALHLNPKNAHALYGRGIAKRNSGDASGGDADITSAKAIEANIAERFLAVYRIK